MLIILTLRKQLTLTTHVYPETVTVLWDLTHWLWFYLAILLYADVITIVLSHLKLYTCKINVKCYLCC